MKTLTKTISILVLALASTMVSAVGNRTYPGTACQPYSGSRAADLNYDGSRIFNNSNTNLVISCPLVRDKYYSTKGISVVVYGYRNAKYSSLLYCSLSNSSRYGTSSGFVSRTNYQAGYFYTNFALSSSNYGGNYTVRCDLPPFSTISQITAYEI